MKRKLFFLAAFLLATVMNLHADKATIDLTSGHVTSAQSLVTYNLDDNISIVITCPKANISNDGNNGTSFEAYSGLSSIAVKAAEGCTITAVTLECVSLHGPGNEGCGFVPGSSTPGISNISQYSFFSGSATQVVWIFTKMETSCILSKAFVTYTKPEPITYIAPAYNTTGDPTSGILQWDTLSCSSYTVVADASSQVTWNAGWYVVKGNVNLSKGAICNGAVNLILADGAMLTTTGEDSKDFSSPACAGIQVSGSSNSLTIYGQEGQTGILIAKGGVNAEETDYAAAGIGGGLLFGEDDCSGSNITINGGVITATGGKVSGAGIGGGYSMGNAFGKNITINGGIITATGSYSSAGIGGGYSEDADGSGSYITINGGTVTATGGYAAASIGGGDKGSGSYITINGGKIEAKAKSDSYYGAGIGGGMGAHGSYITINGGEVTATGGSNGAGIGGGSEVRIGSNITITGGKVTATGGGNGGAGIGGGREGVGSSIIITGGEVTATGGFVDAKYQGDGIGSGLACSTPASDIYVNPALILKAGASANPTEVIAATRTATTDVASDLAGKQYVTAAPPAEPDMHDFLHFVSLKDNGTVKLDKLAYEEGYLSKLTATFEYSTDRKTWTEYTWDAYKSRSCKGLPIALNQGDTVFFRAKGVNGKNNELSNAMSSYRFAFGENDSIAAGGNAMSLYDATCEQDKMTAYGFYKLFDHDGSIALVSAPELPATKLAEKCYASMFNECLALTTAPALPATELAKGCYEAMFSGCEALPQAPELEATEVVEWCYYAMFQACHALTAAPALPAMELAKNCYAYMFYDCPALTKAPALMAFTLADSCYMNMFTECSKLEVNVTTISKSCNGVDLVVPQQSDAYDWNFEMFTGCKGDAALTAEYGIQLGGHYCISEYKEPDMHDMLHLVSLKDNGTVRLNKYGGNDLDKLTATFEYSTDRKTWTEYTWGGTDNKKGAAITLASAGDTVFFRAKGDKGKNATLSYNDVTYFLFAFNSGDSIAAGGNVMSLYDAECKQDTMTAYGFCNLFRDCAKKLVSVSDLKLPVTKLAKGCYYGMFYNCLKITDVPALPVTTLAPSCYVFMFYRCTSLTVAPVLPATTLADNCYSNMFSGCTALTQAPVLPAITLASKCYNLMFAGCSSLTVAPELNATTLADSCYKQMFKGCSKLEVDTCSGSCAGVVFVPTTMGYAPINWNLNMFDGCKGDAKYTAEHGIQLGGHYCIREYKEPDMHDMLYFTSLKADGTGTVQLNKKASIETMADLTATFEYSKDRKNWTEYTWGDWISSVATGAAIALNQGDTVFFRAKGENGKNATMGYSFNAYFRFAFGADDSIAAGGNTMSLYDAKCEQDTMTDGGFYNLFSTNPSLVSVSELKLPAKKLAEECYNTMFEKCTSLTTAPKLPATTLVTCCYYGMFKDCSALTQAPELNVTTLAYQCCYQMFQNCTALTVAPALPATKMAERCYAYMFEGCTSLTAAPELKADSLANLCYYKMFSGCTSLQVDTCADGSCDGVKLEPTHSGKGEPNGWSKKMFENCHGAYANNIQLNGHYCIKKFVPDSIKGVTITDYEGVYDGQKHTVIVTGTLEGDKIMFSSDSANWTNDSIAKNVGETLIYVRVQRTDHYDWYGKGKANITAKMLTVEGTTVKEKDYDASSYAQIITGTLKGVIGSDDVKVDSRGEFNDKNVGKDKDVNVEYLLCGEQADNYTIEPETVKGTIVPLGVFVFDSEVEDKVYDGNTNAVVQAGTLDGVYGSDDVQIESATGTFADANAGKDKEVSVNYTLKGADANNYKVIPNEYSATITKRELTLESADLTKEYDGTPLTAEGTTIKATGYVEGECLKYSLLGSQTAVGESANSFDYSDSDSAKVMNYDVTAIYGTLTVMKSKTPITITANSDSKVYDGTPLTNNGYQVDGTLAAGDYMGNVVVTGSITQVGSVPNQVTGYKIVNAASEDVTSFYSNIQTVDTTLTITPKPLTITAPTVADKEYDGHNRFIATAGTLSGVIAGDEVNVLSVGYAGDKNVGQDKQVVVEHTLYGAAVDNYLAPANDTLTASITPKELTVAGIVVDEKVYDGTADATVSAQGVLQGVIGSDDVSIENATATFADKNAGKDKDVTVIYTLKGEDAANYDVLDGESYATINSRELTLESADLTKEYDGTPLTAEGTTIKATGYVEGECLKYSLLGSQTAVGESPNYFEFSDSETAKADNYDVTAFYGTLTVIKSGELITITANSDSKVYDGTPLTNNGYQVDGTLAAGDYVGNVTVTGTITEVGSVPNEVTGYGIYNASGEDVTTFYSNIQRVAGTLIVVSDKSTCAEANLVEAELPIGLQTVTVAYVNDAYTYIQDETGGALIYANNYGLKAGDRVSGLRGISKPTEGGLPRIIPTMTVEQLTVVSGIAPQPKVMNEAPSMDIINQYVRYEDITITDGLVDNVLFQNAISNAQWMSTTPMVFNNVFPNAHYLGYDQRFDVVATVGVENGEIQLYPALFAIHEGEGVENVNDNDNHNLIEKLMINGVLMIRVNGILYNASGVRVQ